MQYFNKSILYQSQEVRCKYKQKNHINKKRGSVKTKPPGVIKNSHYDCEVLQKYNTYIS